MPRTKNEVLTIRTTTEVKALLRLAAERERRSVASMVEVLVLDHARAHGLAQSDQGQPPGTSSAEPGNSATTEG